MVTENAIRTFRHHIFVENGCVIMVNNNYFSWKNFDEMADVVSHIQYANTLLHKYNWEYSAKSSIEKQLNLITKKQNDKLLNISIIGEFSTGKSSFINALVGYELLAVNVIQGTTVSITIIEYADKFSITLTDLNGTSTRTEYSTIDALWRDLFIYTTDSKYGKRIDFVTVTLPSDILKGGFRIIDTPGTNSLELWHEDVTRKAINELSDLSIIIMDATQAMPDTLLSFVDNALGSAIKDCVFVANKIDLVIEKERVGIVKYACIKAKQYFGIENPIVYPFSSVALTNVFAHDKYNVDSNSVLMTKKSLDSFLSYTARHKVKNQALKLLLLIDGIYTLMNNDIQKIANYLKTKLIKFENTKHTDLKPFIASQIALRQKSFLANARGMKYNVESTGDTLIAKAIDNINSKIYGCTSLDAMSDYIKGKLSSDIQNEGLTISYGMEKKFLELKLLYKKEISSFHKEFVNEFEKLKILSVRLNVKPKVVYVEHLYNSANIEPINTLITDELSKENWAFGGGLAAGAAIGTAIAPGVGTIVGGLFGLFLGGAAAPDLDEVKGKITSKLVVPLKSYYRSIANDCIANYNKYMDDINKSIASEINKYYSIYKLEVQKEIDQWNLRHNTLQNKIRIVQQEMDNIKNRQISIKNIILNI